MHADVIKIGSEFIKNKVTMQQILNLERGFRIFGRKCNNFKSY